jgi:hypothetical protein
VPFGTFLNGRAPTQLRGLQWLSMSDTGHVVRGSATDDQGGGITQVWTAGTGVPCRIDPVSANPGGLTGGRIDERSTHVVTLTAGTSVTTDDRFSIDGRGTFEITALRDRTAEWVREFEVVAT